MMVSAATEGSSGVPLAGELAGVDDDPGRQAVVRRPSVVLPPAWPGSGLTDSNRTAAASTALVETGVSRSPVTHRS